MIIQHNIPLINSERQYGMVTRNQANSSEKLSSGYRINRSADDAAGISISEKMRRQIHGLTQASMNCQDGISLAQVADGALNEVHDILHRGTELSVMAANETLSDDDRQTIQKEISSILDEITALKNRATFNEIKVLDGGTLSTSNYSIRQDMFTNGRFDDSRLSEGSFDLVIQAGSESGQTIEVRLSSISLENMGLDDVDVSRKDQTTDGPLEAIDKFKEALNFVSKERSRMGAYQNRFQHTIKNLDTIVENTTSSESLIRDTDMAKEMITYSGNRILTDAGHSIMAQASKTNEAVMTLL